MIPSHPWYVGMVTHTPYHGEEWNHLVELGWVTVDTYDGPSWSVARMIYQPDYDRLVNNQRFGQ